MLLQATESVQKMVPRNQRVSLNVASANHQPRSPNLNHSPSQPQRNAAHPPHNGNRRTRLAPGRADARRRRSRSRSNRRPHADPASPRLESTTRRRGHARPPRHAPPRRLRPGPGAHARPPRLGQRRVVLPDHLDARRGRAPAGAGPDGREAGREVRQGVREHPGSAAGRAQAERAGGPRGGCGEAEEGGRGGGADAVCDTFTHTHPHTHTEREGDIEV